MIDPHFTKETGNLLWSDTVSCNKCWQAVAAVNVAGMPKAFLSDLELDKHPMDMKVSALSAVKKPN